MNKLSELLSKKDRILQEIKDHKRDISKKESYELGCPSKNFIKTVEKSSREMDQILLEIFKEQEKRKGSSHFSKENTWCWGGPTPLWGGSMDMDTAFKGAEYFGFDNIVYLHGPVNDEAMKIHSGSKKLLCALSEIGRTPGAQPESDVETAENLSRFSLTYKNIKGGMIDDIVGAYGKRYSYRDIEAISRALKKHNKDLKLYSVVYANELDCEGTKIFQPLIDCVNLWFWCKSELIDMDLAVEKCQSVFPGKEIMMGVFMHDYGLSDLGNNPEIVEFQLEKARTLLAAGKINDIVILGDREIAKYPDTAKLIKKFFASEFES